MRDEPTVQPVGVLELQSFHLRLHLGVVGPKLDVRFVATDVDMPARKQLHHFGQHILEKDDRLRTRRDQARGLTPPLLGLQRGEAIRGDAQFRVSDDLGSGVERHLNLRHDRDVTVGRVLDDQANVVLRIEAEAARPRAVAMAEVPVHLRTEFCELGVLLDLDPPALVVRQMDLQTVELVQRHHVEEAQHVVFGDKVTGRIDQQTAPAKARMVRDLHAGHVPRNIVHSRWTQDRRRQKLPQCLDTVEQPCRLRRDDRDPFRRHAQLVALGAERREAVVQPHLDGPLARLG